MSFDTYKSDTYVEKKIKQYFRSNLSQYFEGDEKWLVHWNPNGAFTRPNDLYWLDIWFNATEPSQIELGTGGRNRWSGYLQVNINVPLDDFTEEESEDEEDDDTFGTSAMDKCYNDIAKVFRRGVIFNGIRIIKTCRYPSAMQIQDDFCSMPVRIFWQADLSN